MVQGGRARGDGVRQPPVVAGESRSSRRDLRRAGAPVPVPRVERTAHEALMASSPSTHPPLPPARRDHARARDPPSPFPPLPPLRAPLAPASTHARSLARMRTRESARTKAPRQRARCSRGAMLSGTSWRNAGALGAVCCEGAEGEDNGRSVTRGQK